MLLLRGRCTSLAGRIWPADRSASHLLAESPHTLDICIKAFCRQNMHGPSKPPSRSLACGCARPYPEAAPLTESPVL